MRHKFLIAVLVVLILFGGSFLFGMVVYHFSGSDNETTFFSSDNVGLVKIEGGIYDPFETVRELDEYRKDSDIKAVVIRIIRK